MRRFTQSDVFMNYINKGDIIQKRIFDIISGKANSIILNDKLAMDLERVKKSYKEPTILKAIGAVKSMDMIVVKLSPEERLPDCIPFVKFKKSGSDKLLIALSDRWISESKDSDTGVINYSINTRILYTLILAGYIYLTAIDDNTVLPPDAIKYSSAIWARMFNKICAKAGMLTNSDRRDAFMYFAMEFFMRYYLSTPDVVADNIAINYLQSGTKSQLILDMEETIKELNLNPYNSFVDFCTTLFNNQVSNIKGLRIKNVENSMNTTFFVNSFINMYGSSAQMSLCAYPFFLMVVIDSLNDSNICRDRSLDDVVSYDKKETTRLLNAIYKDLK